MTTATKTRAKFKVHSVNPRYAGSMTEGRPTGEIISEEVLLGPVYSSDPSTENHDFWKATPNGQLTMWLENPQIFGFFQQGKEYYIDFTPVEDTGP